MCITNERNSTICGHRISHTEKCRKESGAFLNQFRKCSPVLNSSYNYEICHDCRHFWKIQGIEEREAIERMKQYRLDKEDYGPVSCDKVLQHEMKRSTSENQKGESLGFSMERSNSSATLWPSKLNPQLEEEGWTAISLDGPAPQKQNGKSVDRAMHPNYPNRVTLWPTFPETQASTQPEILPQTLPQAYHPPGRADSTRSRLETIIIGMESDESLPSPEDFALGNIGKPLPLRPNKERQETHVRPWADLDKPLPRPPRQGSPMPGRPFDSQNPERDLPKNMYYSRVI